MNGFWLDKHFEVHIELFGKVLARSCTRGMKLQHDGIGIVQVSKARESEACVVWTRTLHGVHACMCMYTMLLKAPLLGVIGFNCGIAVEIKGARDLLF